MQVFTVILLGFLLVCAVSVSLSKNLLNSILIYMSYSLVMSIIWVLLESPDLAITEAAVGAGITSVLFFITLKKIHAIVDDDDEKDEATEAASSVATEMATASMATVAEVNPQDAVADNTADKKVKAMAADVKGGTGE